ncbi:MAG: ThiF family adenylyltransferase [Casimicrobiaceae bacterium]
MRSLDVLCADSSSISRAFASVARLYGERGRERLSAGHVAVVGLGGVGSWAAEALARTGMGRLTLMDPDVIAESNLNRQIHATQATLGMNKVDAMRERIADIAPACRVDCIDEFLSAETLGLLLAAGADIVIDATDQIAAKVTLALASRDGRRPLIICGAAGGKRDPLRLRKGDLAEATHDALLARMRTRLRREHGFPAVVHGRVRRFGLTAIWSEESAQAWAGSSDHAPGAPLACGGYGSVVMVTAAMGMAAASLAVESVLADSP